MVWTNAVGVAFCATLLSAGDGGAAFRFAEDGATNVLPLASLSAGSAARVCELTGYVPVQPGFAALFAHARRELDRVSAMDADGRFDADESARRRAAVFRAFRKACLRRGATEDECAGLERRLGAAAPQREPSGKICL